jgi:DNA (cytosine-5)-methyltransferase 1
LLGNSINLTAVQHFLQDKRLSDLKFVDLFAGLGGFHLALSNLGNKCVLALDKDKSCHVTYQLNFPNTPFLLGDINDQEIRSKIINTDFDLLCAGFPCQPFSKANTQGNGESKELDSLLKIIRKKPPTYLLLESVPYLVKGSGLNRLLESLIANYQLQISVVNPKDLGVKQNRPRLFI